MNPLVNQMRGQAAQGGFDFGKLGHADIQIGEAGDVADVMDMVAELDKPKSRLIQIYAWTSVCLLQFSSSTASRVFKRSWDQSDICRFSQRLLVNFRFPASASAYRAEFRAKETPVLLD
ncbi:hypothetical protein NDY24_09785 [Xanthomonas hortorum pv. pelargonii]|nr:hypothetical protein NDY24_09785 [Xanthomonas hortorum pv. pelargonii]